VQSSNAVINGNTFISNTADDSGGALYVLGPATLVSNTIRANIAPSGLELYGSDATLIRNTLIANTASNAALVLYYSDAALYENLVISNTAGCGVFLRASNATLTNTVVADNQTATSEGFGLYIADGSLPHLVHTTIARNGGNQGTGVYVTAFGGDPVTAIMTNTILSSHTWGVYVAPGDAAILESTLWFSNTVDRTGTGTLITGTYNYRGDPRFAADGYHLLSGSAAIDRGVNAGVTTDIDGEARPQGGGYDLGADEAVASDWHYIYVPIVMRQ
jgi:predicted outer membrane repeat protein